MSSKISRLSKYSMLLGNLFEHYDTALYSLLSPFLSTLFFPEQDPITALMLTYAIIPLGMIARPIGSLFFGYIGDVKGRKQALMISLWGMAIVTLSLGLLPTYYQIGLLAPILLSFGRILHNFFAAGEIIGGAILLIENSPESDQDMISSVYNSSTIAGILFASLGVSCLYAFDIIEDYWRILYVIGSLTALFACLIRTKHFSHDPLPNLDVSVSSPIKTTLMACWELRRPLITIAIASGFSYASYMIALVVMNGFIPLITSISNADMLQLNTLLLVVDFLLLPLFGLLAKQFSREKIMFSAGLLALISGLPLFWILEGASLFAIIFVRLCLVTIGACFSASFHAWAQKLIPAVHRYTVISFAYAIGSQVLGGPTPVISLWLFKKTALITSVAWYWMFLGMLSSFFIMKQYFCSKENVSFKNKKIVT